MLIWIEVVFGRACFEYGIMFKESNLTASNILDVYFTNRITNITYNGFSATKQIININHLNWRSYIVLQWWKPLAIKVKCPTTSSSGNTEGLDCIQNSPLELYFRGTNIWITVSCLWWKILLSIKIWKSRIWFVEVELYN